MARAATDTDDRAARRVLVVAFCLLPSATPDGSGVLSTIRALNRRYAIDVVSVKSESLPHIERFHTARLLRVPLGAGSEAERREAFRRAVRRQLEGEAYDLVHVRGPLEGVPACEMRDLRGYKVIYELATFPGTDAGPLAEEARRDEMLCLSMADVVVVASEASRIHLFQRGVGDRVAVIPKGVDVDLFDWELARPSDVPMLVALGPFPKSRDVGTMLQAVSLVLRELPVRLRLIGESDPARAEAIQEKLRTLELEGVVEVLSGQELEDLPPLIAAADVGLASAGPVDRYLAGGDTAVGLLEFMACRRPVIAARIPAVQGVFADGRELVLYEPGDPESLAEAILGLLGSVNRRQAIAQAGYRRVRDEFPASAARRRLLSVYSTLSGISTDAFQLPEGMAEGGGTPTPIALAGSDTMIGAEAAASEELPSSGDTSPAALVDPSGQPSPLGKRSTPALPTEGLSSAVADDDDLPREPTQSLKTGSLAIPEDSGEFAESEEPTSAVTGPRLEDMVTSTPLVMATPSEGLKTDEAAPVRDADIGLVVPASASASVEAQVSPAATSSAEDADAAVPAQRKTFPPPLPSPAPPVPVEAPLDGQPTTTPPASTVHPPPEPPARAQEHPTEPVTPLEPEP